MASNDIGKKIKELREKKGLTQGELAKRMYVKRETVNQWENNTRDLKTDYTIKLADYFGVTCDYILRGIEAENITINKELGLSNTAIKVLKESYALFLSIDPEKRHTICDWKHEFFNSILEDYEIDIDEDDSGIIPLITRFLRYKRIKELKDERYADEIELQLNVVKFIDDDTCETIKLDKYLNLKEDDLLNIYLMKIQQALLKMKNRLDEIDYFINMEDMKWG